MSRLIQRLAALALVLTIILANGAHLAAVQLYGWSSMYLRYSETMAPIDAATFTFNGQLTCGFCNYVNAESKELPDQSELDYSFKLIPLAALSVKAIVPHRKRSGLPLVNLFHPLLIFTQEKPPPKPIA